MLNLYEIPANVIVLRAFFLLFWVTFVVHHNKKESNDYNCALKTPCTTRSQCVYFITADNDLPSTARLARACVCVSVSNKRNKYLVVFYGSFYQFLYTMSFNQHCHTQRKLNHHSQLKKKRDSHILAYTCSWYNTIKCIVETCIRSFASVKLFLRRNIWNAWTFKRAKN